MSSAELARIHQTIADLCWRWPKCFSVLEARRRPLKVGIDRDIAAVVTDLDRTLLCRTLSFYTNGLCYLDNSRPGAPRIDLDGEPCGSVSEEDAAHAAITYAKALQRRAARRQAKRAIVQPSAPLKIEAISTPATSPSPAPKRLGLADLKPAAIARKQQEGRTT
jgi:ProP effector